MQITSLTLFTPDVGRAARHYRDTLGLRLNEQTPKHISFQVGWSRLTFQQADGPLPSVYHVAFGVPVNSIGIARTWLESRAALLRDESGETVFQFSDWRARSIYWKDPDGNILELIAAEDDRQPSTRTPLTAADLPGVAEIGLAVPDVHAFVEHVAAEHGVAPFGEVSETFTPVGETVYGRLIVVKTGRLWFPELSAPALPMPTIVEINGRRLT
jgi:catechol-2,3-dioxygenase